MKKAFLLVMAISILFCAGGSEASEEKRLAEKIGFSMLSLFSPDSIKVQISDGSVKAWIEMSGGTIDRIRIEKIRLSAELESMPSAARINSESSKLEEIIKDSVGEITLAEKDVNDHFRNNENPEGFSGLRFDFKEGGFTAAGTFKTKYFLNVALPIAANGILALHNDAVYLENVVISVKGISQPELLSNIVISKINPLLEFKDIPFPVSFESIIMTESAAIMTGKPQEFKGGETWTWNMPK